MSGAGVSFYTGGQTSVSGSGNVNISAPTSGAQDGILFFQSRSDTQTMSITGSASLGLNGIVYVPSGKLNFTGSGSGKMNTDLVVKSLNITGAALSRITPPESLQPAHNRRNGGMKMRLTQVVPAGLREQLREVVTLSWGDHGGALIGAALALPSTFSAPARGDAIRTGRVRGD